MSHFTVLVIGEDPDQLLAPYHEFECTGRDDEFIQEIDKTEEARNEYENRTVKALRDNEGKLHDYYNEEFYREATPEEIEKQSGVFKSKKVHYTPEGYEEVEVPQREMEGFVDFVKGWYGYEDPIKEGEEPDLENDHKYGYIVVNDEGEVVRVVRRTNPNAKWDWYQVGGRWNGFFRLEPTKLIQGAADIQGETGFTSEELYMLVELKKKSPEKFEEVLEKLGAEKGTQVAAKVEEWATEIYPDRPVGSPGVFGNEPDRNFTGYADQATKGEIDVQGMREDAEMGARKRYQRLKYFFGGDIPKIKTWDDVRKLEGLSIEEKRDYYHGQEPIKRLRKVKEINEKEELDLSEKDMSDILWTQLDEYQCTEDEYAKKYRGKAFSTFAFVYDGNWYEKGEMGFFAIVSNEKDENDWLQEFNKMFDSLPDDTLLTLVDCHI